MKTTKTKEFFMQIRVSEIFDSLQGEGSTMGMPSIFLRLTGCNLMCGGYGTEKDGKLHDGATWRCDTIEVWKKGERYEAQKLASLLVERFKNKFIAGSQLIITGGEPMLQQKALPTFIEMLNQLSGVRVRIEVETNGTVPISSEFDKYVSQYNVSPKLSNSGMPKNKRIKEALKDYVKSAHTGKSIFKFVVTDSQDVDEMMNDFIIPFKIPKSCIYLMPGCSTQEQFQNVAPMVAEVANKNGFHFSSRLQINLWNQTTGV